MKRKLISLFLIIFSCITFAQQYNADDIIPFDQNIKSGELENGLKYFIRNNKKPEQRAELRLVLNAGSILENEDQQGLAHFVEHMAFNGTKNFKKNELVSYLESIGMKFGADINAYTSFDETVYMLQLPTDKEGILEKGFQILEDWAHNVAFEDEEIEKERGVITEEWRLGRGASARIRDKQFPILFNNSQYAQRLPIGKMEIIKSFEYDVLKDFYNDWYRPDLMAVIAVGDFDVEWIEKLIKEHFSEISVKDNARERKYFSVPDHKEILIASATDPEATGTGISVYYKLEDGKQGTVNDYRNNLKELLYNRILSARLRELITQADPPIVTGSSAKGKFIRTKEFYYLGAAVKENKILNGLETLLTEGERVKRFGFTESELERHKTEILRYIEMSYNERDKRESARYADEYIRHFLEEEPVPGIEYEYELQKFLIPSISLEEVNALAGYWMKNSNIVISISGPEKENFVLPSDEELLAVFKKVLEKEVEPYDDKIADIPLLDKIPAPTKIAKEKKYDDLNITEWELENGVKVVLKPTDFKNDEILMRAFSPGGNSLVDDAEYIPAATAAQIINQSGVGNFNNSELVKKLSGKVVRVSPYVSELTEGFTGSASPKDMETMFQLIYLYFNAPRADSTSYLSYRSRVETMVENHEKSPDAAFQDTLSLTLAQYHSRRYPWTTSTLQNMEMNKSFEIYKDRFADASDFTFIFAGSFEIEKIKPFVEIYLANLPSIKRNENFKDIGIRPPKGIIKKEVRKGIEPKSLVNITFTGSFNWSQDNSYLLKSMTSVFRIKLREILREDKGGTYGVKIASSGRRAPSEQYEIEISFGCNPDRVEELTAALINQIDSIRSYEMDESYIEKVKEIQRREIEAERKKNDYWVGTLQGYYFYNTDLSEIFKVEERIEKLNSKDVLTAAKEYFNLDNYIMVLLYPENI